MTKDRLVLKQVMEYFNLDTTTVPQVLYELVFNTLLTKEPDSELQIRIEVLERGFVYWKMEAQAKGKEVERLKVWYDKAQADFNKMYELSLSRCTPEEIESVTSHLKDILGK